MSDHLFLLLLNDTQASLDDLAQAQRLFHSFLVSLLQCQPQQVGIPSAMTPAGVRVLVQSLEDSLSNAQSDLRTAIAVINELKRKPELVEAA